MHTHRAAGYIVTNGRLRVDVEAERTRHRIESVAQAHCAELITVVYETSISHSRSIPGRHELLRALEMIESGFIELIILKDQQSLSPNPVQREFLLSRIHSAGCTVVTLAGYKDDPNTLKMRDTVGRLIEMAEEYQSAVRTQRMRKGREAKTRGGGYAGGRPPYGLRVCDGELIPHPEETKTIGRVLSLRGAGYSYREICRALDDLEIKPRSGKRWQPMTIRRIVERAGHKPHDLMTNTPSEPLLR